MGKEVCAAWVVILVKGMVGIRKNKMISVGTEQGQWRSGWIDPTCLWGSSVACSMRWEGWSSGIRGGRW